MPLHNSISKKSPLPETEYKHGFYKTTFSIYKKMTFKVFTFKVLTWTINSVRDRYLQAQGLVYLLSSILRPVWYKSILNGSYVCFSQRRIWMAFSLFLLRAFWYKEILRRLFLFLHSVVFGWLSQLRAIWYKVNKAQGFGRYTPRPFLPPHLVCMQVCTIGGLLFSRNTYTTIHIYMQKQNQQ